LETIIFYKWSLGRLQAQKNFLSQVFVKINNNSDKYYTIFIVDDMKDFLSDQLVVDLISQFKSFSILSYKENFSGNEISKAILEKLIGDNKISIKKGVVVGRFLSDFSVFSNNNDFHFLLCDNDATTTKSEVSIINNLTELPIFTNW